jgi:hypothetical protein
MINIAAIALVLSYFMLSWYRTNAFVEYMTLFKLTRFFNIAEYNELHKEGYGGVYVDYLAEYYSDKFFVRLLKCPICLSFWLGLFSSIFVGVYQGLLITPLVLLFYSIFNRAL